MISYLSGNMGLWAFFMIAVLALLPGESNQQATQRSTSNLTCSRDGRNMLKPVINLKVVKTAPNSSASDRIVESVETLTNVSGQDTDLILASLQNFANGQQQQIQMMANQTNQMLVTLNTVLSLLQPKPPRDCAELLALGIRSSGRYVVYDGSDSFPVYCDMETDGGGWTVFQRRQDGSVNFERDWAEYRHSFGEVSSEFWLGLERLHSLTEAKASHLRVDMSDWDNNTAYAEYSHFHVAGKKNKYRLSLSGFNGTAGNSMAWHHGRSFSTQDRNNDANSNRHCAQLRRGAWWYGGACDYSNLNGVYRGSGPRARLINILWTTWKGSSYALQATEMKLRPV